MLATTTTTMIAKEVVVVVGAIRWQWWSSVVVSLWRRTSHSKEGGLCRTLSISVLRGLLTKKKFTNLNEGWEPRKQ
jgi:hypothetical protein